MRRSIESHSGTFVEERASPGRSANVKRPSKYVDLVLSPRVLSGSGKQLTPEYWVELGLLYVSLFEVLRWSKFKLRG